MTTIARLDSVEAVGLATELFRQVWRTTEAPVPANLVRAIDHAGGYAYGAYDATGTLVAASVGFLGGEPGAPYLYSHITGVRTPRGGVGRALKLHQRAWSLERGISRVVWTFDPLVRRNAAFNIAALGARPVSYLVDFYGPMDDGINRGDETDRLLVEWRLTEPPAAERAALAVDVPADIEELRRTEPDAARQWRHRVRAELGGALADGRRVVGFGAEGYLLSAR